MPATRPSLRWVLAAVWLAIAATTARAEGTAATTALADPPPSLDQPRRILLQLTSDAPGDMNNILHNAVNLQKFYGMDQVRIRIVAYGAGMRALYEDDSPVADRVRSLMHYDIEFFGCGNTLEATHRTAADLIDGVQVVPAGIAEIVERQLDGWVYVRP